MHDWWPEGTVADVIESSEAMSDANGDARLDCHVTTFGSGWLMVMRPPPAAQKRKKRRKSQA